MISAESRSEKPYAVSVRCVPYHSLSEAKARIHINEVITEMITEMKKTNMKVAGLYCVFLTLIFTFRICQLR